MPDPAVKKAPKAYVIIAADHVGICKMYEMYLRHVGYEVRCVRDGTAALAAARERRPHVIVLDGEMPGLDGWEAARMLKDDAALRDIPVVILTARAYENESADTATVAADHVLRKPCLPHQLQLRLEAIVK